VSAASLARERSRRLARYYDLDFLDTSYDAELYQQLAHESGGPVLELGTGTGRLAIPLALAGHEVVGIDNDPAMLERARARWAKVGRGIDRRRFEPVPGDFTSYHSDRRFGLAFIAVNTFLLAPDDAARLSILGMMRNHLRPRGIAAVEVGMPDEGELGRYDRRLQHEWLRVDPETGEEVSKSISADHDPEEGTMELTQIFEWTPTQGGPLSRVTRTDVLHPLGPDQLVELARAAGFGVVDVWGDHLLTPYGARSHRAILVARLV
jgi:SAM-dependent methyltransferase